MVAGKVKNVHGEPLRGAAVTVAPLVGAGGRFLQTDDQGQFSTQYLLNAEEVRRFTVILTVKKKGFETAHIYADYADSNKSWEIPITLREPKQDPTLLSSEDLISGLVPRLKHLGPAEGLSSKGAKDYTHGLTEFLDHHRPEQAVPLLSKVVEASPDCIACRTLLGLVELSWNDWDDANRAFAESVNASLANPKTARPEPLIAFGTWISWQHEPEKAEPYFAEALKYAPQDALALQELGRARLLTQKYDAAVEDLKKALGAGAGQEAQLLEVEALFEAGRIKEAAAQMDHYLGGRDIKTLPVHVRQVWVNLQDQEKVLATYGQANSPKDKERLDFLQRPPAELIQGLEPARDQEQLSSILEAAGAKIVELIEDFPNTSSLEEIHQEKLTHKGKVGGTQSQKFRYLCLVPHESWGPGFAEYRTDVTGTETPLGGLSDGYMLTTGFASAEMVFHPTYRSESTFRYLGRQKIDGQDTLLVAFAQTPGRAHLAGAFLQNGVQLTTYSQGLAWIDNATHAIVRLHTDLLAPLPDVRLERESTDIDFHEVRFSHASKALWLPEEVTVAIDWNGKRLRNQHKYTDFQVFGVDASEKIGKPKAALEPAREPR